MADDAGRGRGFRHASLEERRRLIADRTAGENSIDQCAPLGTDTSMVELADLMVESAVGYLAVPLGIASGFVIDGRSYDVPMATEEPSVIAAATYAARRVAACGGFSIETGETITSGQIFLEQCDPDARARLEQATHKLSDAAGEMLVSMTKRGGGWRGYRVEERGDKTIRVQFDIDVRDAMGANLVNTVGEKLRPVVESISGGRCLLAILTNASSHRVTTARCAVPVRLLARGGVAGDEAARRIACAARIAQEDPERAVTHNKGIMNGISALALATGNDTRASEAAAHAYAARSGQYLGLSTHTVENGSLVCSLTMPIALGTVGGATTIHPTCRMALRLLGSPSARVLAGIAAAVGLAQNIAALHALVTEGIQRGHMGLHARRTAYLAGARGNEINEVVARMRSEERFDSASAVHYLNEINSGEATK